MQELLNIVIPRYNTTNITEPIPKEDMVSDLASAIPGTTV